MASQVHEKSTNKGLKQANLLNLYPLPKWQINLQFILSFIGFHCVHHHVKMIHIVFKFHEILFIG